MLYNAGNKGDVISFTRLDQVALEPPPDAMYFPNLATMQQGLGGLNAPSGVGGYGGGGVPPVESVQDIPSSIPGASVIITSAAPSDRQKPDVDGTRFDTGGLTATPPASVRQQEGRKGIVDVLGELKYADYPVLTTNIENVVKNP